MQSIRCEKCGTNNTLVMQNNSTAQGSVNLNCGNCKNLLLTIQTRKAKNSTPYGKSIICAVSLAAIWMFIPDLDKHIISTFNSINVFSAPQSETKKTNYAKAAFYRYNSDQRKLIQKGLKHHYNYNGTIDGLWGPATASAYQKLRKAEKENVKGLSHEEVYANMIRNQANSDSAPIEFLNLLGTAFLMKQLGGQGQYGTPQPQYNAPAPSSNNAGEWLRRMSRHRNVQTGEYINP